MISHGTQVAGIASAKTNNSKGISGVAGGWGAAGAKLMTLGVGYYTPISFVLDDAILYACSNGANVIQMSLSAAQSSAIDAALQTAYQTYNCFVVCAAGNDNGPVSYPANNQYVIAVGATDRNDVRANFSNYGPTLDVVAPGVEIYSTAIDNTYVYGSGTSFAAPQVSALGALLLSINSNLTNAQIESIIEQTSEDKGAPGFDNYYGYGKINAYEALKYTIENYGGTFDQNLIIPSNDSWTIVPGVTLMFESGSSLIVNGHLEITGTSGSNVVFTNSGGGSWSGIMIGNEGSADIDYANIQNATTGVKFESGSSGSVSNSILSNNTYGIYISGAEPTIEGNTISSNTYGIYVTNSYSPNFRTEPIKNNTIQSNSGYGIYLYNSSPTLSGNVVSSCNNGAALFTNCNPMVYNNDITSNSSYGFACYGSSSPTVYYYTYFEIGGYNQFLSNGSDEVRITGTSNPDFGNSSEDGNNSFDDNSGYLMYNSTGSTISAENNWWGSSSGPGVNQIYGSVDYDPYLDEDPNNPSRAIFIDNPSLAVSNINSTEDLSNAFNAYYGGNFTLAASLFKEYLNQNPKSENALKIIQYYYYSR